MSTSAIRNLQKSIAEGKKPITQLLREAKLISAKLNQTDVEAWLDHELNGYPVDAEIPSYRNVSTYQLEVRNPVRGWDFAGQVNLKFPINKPIAGIEDLAKGDAATLASPRKFPVRDQLGIEHDYPQRVVIDGGQFRAIVEAVTNALLQWVIMLEKRGIKGEDMDFDENEKQAAANQVFHIHNSTGVFGNMSHSQITLHDFSTIHQTLKENGVPQDQRNELENIMDSLKTASPEAKKSLLERGKEWLVRNKEFLGSAAEVVRKAIGLPSV